ncbi:MAG: flagellar protein FlgJ [Alphaproteobacteria bacterium]|jgi:flagellar protein FlgJ
MAMNSLPPSAITATQAIADGPKPRLNARAMPDEIRKSAQEFEAFFLSQMVGHMFEGLDVDAQFGGGQGETVYRSLMVQEYGRTLSKAGGVGIADMVGREMMRLQETRQ